MWRAEVKHFCDQQCLLKFYCQQNEPIMVTQKGPENTGLGIGLPGTKLGVRKTPRLLMSLLLSCTLI